MCLIVVVIINMFGAGNASSELCAWRNISLTHYLSRPVKVYTANANLSSPASKSSP